MVTWKYRSPHGRQRLVSAFWYSAPTHIITNASAFWVGQIPENTFSSQCWISFLGNEVFTLLFARGVEFLKSWFYCWDLVVFIIWVLCYTPPDTRFSDCLYTSTELLKTGALMEMPQGKQLRDNISWWFSPGKLRWCRSTNPSTSLRYCWSSLFWSPTLP